MSETALIIKEVCNNLGLDSRFIDDSNFVLEVSFGGKEKHIFVANNSGLNDEAVKKICSDKFYTHILLKDELSLPRTLSFVDPNADDIYKDSNVYKSNDEVVAKILENHQLPVIVKANSLSRGLNVFKCEDKSQVSSAVENVFNKKSKDYDHVLISQDYLNIESEYRVVIYDQEIMFLYKKDKVNGEAREGALGYNSGSGDENGGNAKFVGNLSPLHWENSKAVLIDDKKIIGELADFIKPIFSKLKLRYGGLDIARDKNGKLWLIEINTQPGFTYFIRDNSEDEIVKMYKKILSDLKEKYDE